MTETQLLDWIATLPLDDPRVLVGPGDDCAILQAGEGEGTGAIAVTTDALVEGVHFEKETPPRAVGRKAVLVNLSDIAAVGFRPVCVVASACLPAPLDETRAKEMVAGIGEACAQYGCALVGGDLNESPRETVISCTALGTGDAASALLRSGAKPGESVFVTGELGGSILGKHSDFTPRLREARELCERGVRCAIDISDGLALDSWRLARSSGVRVLLDEDRLPLSDAARRLARRDGKRVSAHALEDGEDFELLFTAREELLEGWSSATRLSRIGRVEEGEGVILVDSGGKEVELEPRGYEHWRR